MLLQLLRGMLAPIGERFTIADVRNMMGVSVLAEVPISASFLDLPGGTQSGEDVVTVAEQARLALAMHPSSSSSSKGGVRQQDKHRKYTSV